MVVVDFLTRLGRVGALWAAVATLQACETGAGERGAPTSVDAQLDAALPAEDASAADFAMYAPLDAGERTDAVPGEVSSTCASDDDCRAGDVCNGARCEPAAPAPNPAPDDGVARAGIARFDLAPTSFETWTDRASAECPTNRPGVYDGALNLNPAPDRCEDTFEDTDADGEFDAVWLAGAGGDRPARLLDVGNPPEGQVLVVRRGERVWVLVSLDVYAIGPAQLRALTHGVALRTGLAEAALSVHATGARSAPDAVGLSGPTLVGAGGREAPAVARLLERGGSLFERLPLSSGASAAWWQGVVERAASAVESAHRGALPVTIQVGQAALPLAEPDAAALPTSLDALRAALEAPTLLSQDERWPLQRDDRVRALLLRSSADATPVAVVGAWGASPAGRVSADAADLSADHPGHARRALQSRFPGALALWLTYAASDEVTVGARAFVPETDANGAPVDAQGLALPRDASLRAAQPALDRDASLGRLLAAFAAQALERAPEATPLALELEQRVIWLPLRNPRWALAAHLGLVSGLGEWLSGRSDAAVWSDGAVAPACGGLGCLRSRLDRVHLGPLTLLTVPGGLDEGYVRGRPATDLALGDALSANWLDVDMNGVEDTLEGVPGALNPQSFDALDGLESDGVWVLGRTNGGVGTARPPSEVVPVFEGALHPDATQPSARAPRQAGDAEVSLCALGFACDAAWTLETLSRALLDALPDVLRDRRGGHLLALVDGPASDDQRGGAPRVPRRWRVVGVDGGLRAEGDALLLLDGRFAYHPTADFFEQGVAPGDVLELLDPPAARRVVEGVVPVELAQHPGAGDVWRATSPDAGDLVFNAACALLNSGACPAPRPLDVTLDPCQTLPCGGR